MNSEASPIPDKRVVRFIENTFTSTREKGKDQPFPDLTLDNSYLEIIHDAVVITKTSPSLKLAITAKRNRRSDQVYWVVCCSVANALNTISNFKLCADPISLTSESERHSVVRLCGRVADNGAVRSMLDLLCMADVELERHCGLMHPLEYRSILVKNLDNLWD